jgi:amino acid permease
MPTLGALPIYLFAFTNHQNAISATNEMDRHYSPFACRPPLGMLQPLSMRRG